MTKAAPLTSWHAQRHANDGTRVFNREWRAHGTRDGSGAPDSNYGNEPLLTPELVADVQARHAAGQSVRKIAGTYGVSFKTIARYLTGEVKAREPRAPAAVPVEPFVPLCMEPDELADWNDHNRAAARHGKAPNPCHDCMPDFALEMRAEGRCNGHPRGVEPGEDEPEEPARKDRHMQTVLVRHACDMCVHSRVCGRRASIANLTRGVEIETDPLPAGLTIALEARVDCDAYLPMHKSRAKGSEPVPQGQGEAERPRRQYSAEALQHIRENGAKARAAAQARRQAQEAAAAE